MIHAKRAAQGEQPKLDMTPMIDVVFQLLIFFVVALKQDDILAQLTAARPECGTTHEKPIELINITVGAKGFALNGCPVRQAELDRQVGHFAEFSKKATVVIRCAGDSPHAFLVQALDICNKHQMSNLSVFSM
jgi:biopolymer transport protein ExbD